MDAHTAVSLILIADGDLPESQRCSLDAWMGATNPAEEIRSAEILLIGTSQATDAARSADGSENESVGRTFEDHLIPCDSLAAAIKQAKHETLVFVDLAVAFNSKNRFDRAQLDWVIENTKPSSALVYFESPLQPSKWHLVLMACYQFLIRVLLGTRKTGLHHGFVVMPKQAAQRVLVTDMCFQASNDGEGTGEALSKVWQLLALAKLDGLMIEEIESRRSGLETGAAKLNQSAAPNARVAGGSAPFEPSQSGWWSIKSVKNRLIKLNPYFQISRSAVRFWWQRVMFPANRDDALALQKSPSAGFQIVAWGVLLVAACSLLFGSLSYPLFEPDEARNAQLAMNVIESGDWLSLTLAGEPYWDKPPMQIWAIATSYCCLGVSPFATRVPGALATVLTILLTFGLGRRLIGFRAAFVGAVLLMLSCGFVLIGRYVTMDASLTLSVLLVSMLLLRAVRSSGLNTGWLLLAGLAAGVGLLVKGPVVLALTGPPLIGWLWLNGNVDVLRNRSWWKFFAPMLLVATPWFLATALVHPDFLTYFFWKHHVVRFSDAFNHREPFWYYLPAILLVMFPVSYLLPSLVRFLLTRGANRLSRTQSHGFLFLWAAWVLGFFSLAESKLPTYILPALPPLCLLAGLMLDRTVLANLPSKILRSIELADRAKAETKRRPYRFLETLPQRATIGIAGLSAAMLLVVGVYLREAPISGWWIAAAVIGLSALTILTLRDGSQPSVRAWVCLGVVSFAFVSTSIHLLVPQISDMRSVHYASLELRSQPGNEELPIVFFGREDYGSQMVLPQEACFQFEDDEVIEMCEFLQQHPQSIIISSKTPIKKLRRRLCQRGNFSIHVEQSDVGRHLYLSYPQRSQIADDANDADGTLLR